MDKLLRKFAFVAGSVLCVSLPLGTANAVVQVLGGGYGQMCYEAARAIEKPYAVRLTGSRVDIPPLELCTMAIASSELSVRDLAGTYNNRGVLYFAEKRFEEALRDFESAIRYQDAIGEIHVNRGASLVALKRYAESIPSLTRGIELQGAEPEKAYYNRAIAYEELGDARRAYYDYLKASELKPDWELPKQELTRFTVRKN